METLTKRVDFWARHSATGKVYLIQDDDEVVFTAILAQMETLIEYQDKALNFLDTIRPFLQKYSDADGHTIARTGFVLKESTSG